MQTDIIDKHEFMTGGGEMGKLIRSINWSKTPVGDPSGWPQSLRTALSIMLDTHFPMYIAWGNEFTQFYNDGYRPILGSTKHPHAMGISTKETFAEIWDIIGPMFEGVMQGKAVEFNEYMLPLDRHGYKEECYFLFSYSPVRDESGGVGGVLVTVTETTERVSGERRLKTLRVVADYASEAKTVQQACEMTLDAIQQNSWDIPFALYYQLQENGQQAELKGQVRLVNNTLLNQTSINFSESSELPFPVARVATTGKASLIRDLDKKFPGLPGGQWPEEAREAYVIPVTRPEREHPYGVLVLGISPRRSFDEDYKTFFKLFTDHAATSIANALAYETERKRTEALLEIDRLKTAFFSNISHEFRTPLTLMLGPLEEALKENNNDKVRLELIHRNAKRLLKLVNNLLDFSSLEAGKMQATFRPVKLGLLTTDLASTFRSIMENAGIEYDVYCPEAPEPVYVDKDLWEKIVLNLLSNAYKFTFKGKVSLRLDYRENNVLLTVKDTGIGIPQNEISNIFQRFHRVLNSEGRTHEGTGIGLSLVLELVHLHGGSVDVKSEYGVGSEFTITLPTGKAHLPADKIKEVTDKRITESLSEIYLDELTQWSQEPAQTAEEKEPTKKEKKPYLLIADDNRDMREYIQHLLKNEYEIKTVADGKAAWETIRQRQPDIILADIMMPLMNGFELLERIRCYQETCTIPVIMLSARAGNEARTEGINAGADDYLVKPFNAAELKAIVKSNLALAGIHKEVENRLQVERKKFYNLFMQTPVAILIVRGENYITELANANSLLLLGKKRDEITGKPLMEIIPEFAGQEFNNILNHVYKTGEVYSGREMQFTFNRLGNQETGYYNLVFQPLREPDQAISGVILAGYEVTEMVLARRKIEASENYFRLMADTVPVMIWMTDKEGHCTYLNKKWFDYTGQTAATGLGSGWLSVVHPDDVNVAEAIFKNAIYRLNSFTIEYRLKGNDGKYRWMIDSGSPKFNEKGEPDGFIGCVIDIEKRKYAESAVVDRETRFRQLADSMPQIVWTANPDGFTDYFNQQWYSIMGLDEKVYGDDSFVPLLHPDDRERALQNWHTVIKTGELYETEYRFNVKKPYEGYRWFLARAIPIKDQQGKIVKWYGTCTDIDDVKRIEQNLRESEQRFRVVADSAPVMVWMSDTNKLGYFFNKGWLEYTGRNQDQEMGKGWIEGVHPDDREMCLKIYNEAFDAREKFEIEYRLRRFDGEYRWILDHGIPRFSASGTFLGYIGSCIEIHGRKEMKEELERRVLLRTQEISNKNEELRRQNDFIQTILDSSVDAIAVVDKEARYISMNKKCLEIYNKTREEILGKKMVDVFPQTKDSITVKAIYEALQGKPLRNLSYKSAVVNRHFETYFIPLKDSLGEIYGVLLIAHDNTEIIETAEKLMHSNAELEIRLEELRQSEERYHKMTNEVEDYAIILLDKEGNIRNWNRGAEKIKGYTAEEAIGKNFRIFYLQADIDSKLPEKLINTAIQEGKATHEGWRVRKDGNKFWTHVVLTALHNVDGEVIGFSKVTRDLTERKLAEDQLKVYAEQLEQKNRELERTNSELTSFSYVASHDLQEPLRKIQAFGNLILDKDADAMSEKGKDYFSRMIKAANRMQNLIDSLLEFSRTNTQDKNFANVSLEELLEEVKKELREMIEEKKATIKSGQLPKLRVIPFQVKQLLSNLITNSIKYAKENEPPVIEITGQEISAEQLQERRAIPGVAYFKLSVCDNGIGFEQEYANKIFELFQRLHGRNEYRGSGIGLAICKKIAENHNGFITAESEPGKGAAFHFYIPLTPNA